MYREYDDTMSPIDYYGGNFALGDVMAVPYVFLQYQCSHQKHAYEYVQI